MKRNHIKEKEKHRKHRTERIKKEIKGKKLAYAKKNNFFPGYIFVSDSDNITYKDTENIDYYTLRAKRLYPNGNKSKYFKKVSNKTIRRVIKNEINKILKDKSTLDSAINPQNSDYKKYYDYSWNLH